MKNQPVQNEVTENYINEFISNPECEDQLLDYSGFYRRGKNQLIENTINLVSAQVGLSQTENFTSIMRSLRQFSRTSIINDLGFDSQEYLVLDAGKDSVGSFQYISQILNIKNTNLLDNSKLQPDDDDLVSVFVQRAEFYFNLYPWLNKSVNLCFIETDVQTKLIDFQQLKNMIVDGDSKVNLISISAQNASTLLFNDLSKLKDLVKEVQKEDSQQTIIILVNTGEGLVTGQIQVETINLLADFIYINSESLHGGGYSSHIILAQANTLTNFYQVPFEDLFSIIEQQSRIEGLYRSCLAIELNKLLKDDIVQKKDLFTEETQTAQLSSDGEFEIINEHESLLIFRNQIQPQVQESEQEQPQTQQQKPLLLVFNILKHIFGIKSFHYFDIIIHNRENQAPFQCILQYTPQTLHENIMINLSKINQYQYEEQQFLAFCPSLFNSQDMIQYLLDSLNLVNENLDWLTSFFIFKSDKGPFRLSVQNDSNSQNKASPKNEESVDDNYAIIQKKIQIIQAYVSQRNKEKLLEYLIYETQIYNPTNFFFQENVSDLHLQKVSSDDDHKMNQDIIQEIDQAKDFILDGLISLEQSKNQINLGANSVTQHKDRQDQKQKLQNEILEALNQSQLQQSNPAELIAKSESEAKLLNQKDLLQRTKESLFKNNDSYLSNLSVRQKRIKVLFQIFSFYSELKQIGGNRNTNQDEEGEKQQIAVQKKETKKEKEKIVSKSLNLVQFLKFCDDFDFIQNVEDIQIFSIIFTQMCENNNAEIDFQIFQRIIERMAISIFMKQYDDLLTSFDAIELIYKALHINQQNKLRAQMKPCDLLSFRKDLSEKYSRVPKQQPNINSKKQIHTIKLENPNKDLNWDISSLEELKGTLANSNSSSKRVSVLELLGNPILQVDEQLENDSKKYSDKMYSKSLTNQPSATGIGHDQIQYGGTVPNKKNHLEYLEISNEGQSRYYRGVEKSLPTGQYALGPLGAAEQKKYQYQTSKHPNNGKNGGINIFDLMNDKFI